MKERMRLLLPWLVAGLAVGMLFLELLTWRPHADAVLPYLLLRFLPVLCVAGGVIVCRRREWKRLAMWAVALVVCLWAFETEKRIPLCTMCGGVTPESVGWMASFLTWGP